MPLSDRMLNWIIKSIHDEATVQSIVRLKGSTSSILHNVCLSVGQQNINVVIRQFNDEAWLQEEPDLVIHEANSLRWAEKASVQTPKIIAYDETGEMCGSPAVLMSTLDGKVNLKPADFNRWVQELAQALMSIHNVPAHDFAWSYFSYQDVAAWPLPTWSRETDMWKQLVEVAQGPAPDVEPCFIHRDYHPANVLWQDERISGVVDWVNACYGPPGVDVGHCRVNLAMLYGVETADAFLSAYEQHAAPKFSYAPYWDIIALIDILFGPPTVYPGWSAFGVTGLTDDMMAERLDVYAQSLLDRLQFKSE